MRLVRGGLRIMLVPAVLAGFMASAEDDGMQKETLAQLRGVLAPSKPWEIWLEESGELPPDFDAMPSVANLEDPLAPVGEARITTSEAWRAQRESLKQQLQHWILGTVPPRPDNLEARLLEEHEEPGAVVREVELTFGKGHKGKLWLKLLIPKGDGPFPVFMTQENHLAWAHIALRRGYIGCVYAGSDSRDDTDTFLEACPGYDWSRLMRRAWAGSRCIDYLETVPQADIAKIAITGHSRNGKLSLIASAYDERFAAVISSSSGAGGACSTRYFSEQHGGEGIEMITRRFPDWFHPRWRFFVGREDKLPVDLHHLVALSAPRACLISTALNDHVEDAWAVQQTYLSTKPVYELLGAEVNDLAILWRPAGHETWPTIIERYVDWCDIQFGRSDAPFPTRLIYPHDWRMWRENAGATVEDIPSVPTETPKTIPELEQRRGQVRAAVEAMLGTPPPGAANPLGTYGREPVHIERMLRRDTAGTGLVKEDVMFGEYINADVYMPEELRKSGKPLPAVLWLHSACAAGGYTNAYKRGEYPFRTMANAGFAVFCYDQIGTGRRLEEVEGFYDKHPDWSILGKMIRDAQAALDAMAALDYIDSDRIYVVGYSMGAFLGLHLAVIDGRPAGYALTCIPQPFRHDTPDRGTGGLEQMGRLRMLAPRMGLFVCQEDRMPYEVDDLIACMAPRPVCIVSPTLDRDARVEDVTRAVDAARETYALHDAEDALKQEAPEDYSHFDIHAQQRVIDWLCEVKK
jgi:dienelactone hydrolase